ncbi:uncharacterized protein F5891DRAFT_302429 [Suillus fuscotomentosus]|uniref:Secreted protein n=1 Tax=Suillus fuscotomentosus TaxID=1912939 RepID=A0AAD4HM94_9AGAM|nr:uncharacterized protein F5891DRAFT_302429 [Suillus fuscotomentosus]KAG1900644.1 hypothetical protein F5891DRAFT_302429 [Suillus fuscotomentosus]
MVLSASQNVVKVSLLHLGIACSLAFSELGQIGGDLHVAQASMLRYCAYHEARVGTRALSQLIFQDLLESMLSCNLPRIREKHWFWRCHDTAQLVPSCHFSRTKSMMDNRYSVARQLLSIPVISVQGLPCKLKHH